MVSSIRAVAQSTWIWTIVRKKGLHQHKTNLFFACCNKILKSYFVMKGMNHLKE